MNLTLSIDDELLAKARKRAAEMGTSVNQIVRDHLRCLVRQDDPAEWSAQLRALSGKGNSNGWKFNRDDIYEERLQRKDSVL